MKIESNGLAYFTLADAPPSFGSRIRSIPANSRYFDDETRQWTLSANYLEYIVQAAAAKGVHVEFGNLLETHRRAVETSKVSESQSFSDSPYAVLYLTEGAPAFIVEAVWKAVARKHHPDVGGDEAVFKKYHAAYLKVKR